ncbi:MAG: hypothetical protein V4673_14410 [Pseudomonadota bacterium]
MTSPSRVTLELTQHAETSGDKAAFFLSHDGDYDNAVWIPKSLCARLADGKFSIERWKATQEKLLVPGSPKQGSLTL